MSSRKPYPIHLAAFVAFALSVAQASAANLVANPSFERGADDEGLPVGWSIGRDAVCKFTGDASAGALAVTFAEGYNVLQQDFVVEDMPGKNLRIKLDTRGEQGALLGFLVGFLHEAEDGKRTWQNHRMTWDRRPGAEYTTHRFSMRLPEDARGPRLWIGIYRSNRQGVLWVDNVQVAANTLTAEQQVAMHRIEREWRYLRERAENALEALGGSDALKQIRKEAATTEERCFDGDSSALDDAGDLAARLEALSAQVNATLYPDQRVAAGFAHPYERLGPGDVLAPQAAREAELLALPGERRAIGVTLASTVAEPLACFLSIDGAPEQLADVRVRRQGFLETWYRKEHERLADPLGLLPEVEGRWETTLESGETAKLCVQFSAPQEPGSYQATVAITLPDGAGIRLPIELEVLPHSAPAPGEMNHIAFMYPTSNIAAHSPEQTAADLGAHGVTMMEFPYLPPCQFTPEGKLLSADFHVHEAWLRAYTPHVRQMMIFWPPQEGKLKCGEEQFLPLHSDAWNRGYAELLSAFFERAQEMGLGMDRFSILPYDEPHSASLDAAPDEHIRNVASVMELLAKRFPDLEQVLTISNYTFPADVKVLLPFMDVAIPNWPYPTSLSRNAPPTYNPRQAYGQETLPALEQARRERGLKIWSYHVAGGKSDDALIYNRAYPIRAAAVGQTGVATWAYNVPRQSSWDDTDGGMVDYIYVYDGKEDHPENRRINPTGEVVVPSVRWEALSAGIRDANLLLALKAALAEGAVPDALRAEVQSVLARAQEITRDTDALTWEQVEELSRDLRRLWGRAGQ